MPHGSSKGASVSSAGTDVRALITVQCPDSVLLVRPFHSEGLPCVLDALAEGLGEGGEDDLELLLGDSPETLDCQATYNKLSIWKQ